MGQNGLNIYNQLQTSNNDVHVSYWYLIQIFTQKSNLAEIQHCMTCIPGDIGSVLHRVEFQPNWNLLETERDTYGVSAFARQIHNFTGCAI